MITLKGALLSIVFFWTAVVQMPSTVQAAAAGSPGKAVMKQLVEGARKEKQVYLYPTTSGSDEVIQGFKNYLKRLGLELDLKVDASGGSFQKISQAIGETKQGIVPAYDVQFGGAHEIIHLLEANGVKRVDNLESLVSEIAPQALPVLDKISPGPFKGRAFTFGHWIKAIIYNPKLISAKDLPQSHKELGDPKYKGSFALPPWTSDADAALLAYDKDQALEIIKAIGRNKAATERESAAVNRMLLGEFKFVDANAHYYHEFKGRDPRAPIGLEFFRDYTTINESMYFVREGARNANAATLFVLWTLSEEGQQIFEKATAHPNIYLPSSHVGREIMGMMKKRKVKIVSYVENEESLKKLKWMSQTEEGKAWTQAIARAWRGK
ncbi:MAG: extracellular solute-binding protein [Deltaproteobacteria bacterium]|nr:extracellular solute-binding protein [Deltaproteobacteria bacterium]